MSRSVAGKGRRRAKGEQKVATSPGRPDDAVPAEDQLRARLTASRKQLGVEMTHATSEAPSEAGEGRQKATEQKNVALPSERPDDAVPAVASGITVGEWTLRPYSDGWTIGRWVTSGGRTRWRGQTFYGRIDQAKRALYDLLVRDGAAHISLLDELETLERDVYRQVHGCTCHASAKGGDDG